MKNPYDRSRNVYTYAADGRKLHMKQSTGSEWTNTKTTDYTDNRVYGNGMLKYTLFPGGYIDANNQYHFYRKNHLGNVRVVVDAQQIIKLK